MGAALAVMAVWNVTSLGFVSLLSEDQKEHQTSSFLQSTAPGLARSRNTASAYPGAGDTPDGRPGPHARANSRLEGPPFSDRPQRSMEHKAGYHGIQGHPQNAKWMIVTCRKSSRHHASYNASSQTTACCSRGLPQRLKGGHYWVKPAREGGMRAARGFRHSPSFLFACRWQAITKDRREQLTNTSRGKLNGQEVFTAPQPVSSALQGSLVT